MTAQVPGAFVNLVSIAAELLCHFVTSTAKVAEQTVAKATKNATGVRNTRSTTIATFPCFPERLSCLPIG